MDCLIINTNKMKKLIKHTIMMISAGILSLNLHAQTATLTDAMKNPGPVDLEKHPEVMAKVKENVKNGKIVYRSVAEGRDTTLDLSKHPELVKAIIKNPANWPVILKAYNNNNDTLTVLGKNKQVIRDILAYLIRKQMIKARSDVSSFLLTDKAFTVNGKQLPEKMHTELRNRFIKGPNFVVYYGNSEKKGEGIFQRAGNL
jgi:hypothetical protein